MMFTHELKDPAGCLSMNILYLQITYADRVMGPPGFKGEVQSRITIISKERVKISLQIGSKIIKIG